MSVSVTRLFSAVALLTVLVPGLLKAEPSYRTAARMAFDESSGRMILFGGITPPFTLGDSRNVRSHLAETWEFTGRRWVQLFPDVQPAGRASFAMVADTNRDRVLLFGGIGAAETLFNDTWSFQSGSWTEIETPNAPPARRQMGFTFDPIRDRFIVYGGFGADNTRLKDHWEFDGTTWTKIGGDGPDVANPMIAWDGTRNEVLLMGFATVGTEIKSVMYRRNGDAWQELTPEHKPACVGLGTMIWQSHNGRVLYPSGACTNGFGIAETWEWDGSDWTKLTVKGSQGEVYSYAAAWDPIRQETLLFGGSELSVERSDTFRYQDGVWTGVNGAFKPGPRSLMVFASDPERGSIWMFGGLNTGAELWQYQGGRWRRVTAPNAPATCVYPVGAWDTDRNRLVVLCQDSSTYEFDGTEWKTFANLDKKPKVRWWSSMAYDATLKKTVLYGGFDQFNFLKETWTWNGSTWTKVEGKSAMLRGLASMFYDPISKKTIIYGGIGRKNNESILIRHGDTWSFNGKDWVELTNVNSPPARYGALIATDPTDGRTHLFGGKNENEVFVGDHWVWDGSRWSQVNDTTAPSARMNGGMGWDPFSQRLVIFGGYSGLYYSDLWALDGAGWTVVRDDGRLNRPVTRPPAAGSRARIVGDRVQ